MSPITLEEWANGAALPPSFYTVRKRGDRWAVMLVYAISDFSPSERPLYGFHGRDAAIARAREMAAHDQLPFKMRGEA